MKKTQFPSYIKTKVVIDFGNQMQAKAFFNLFDKTSGDDQNRLELILKSLSKNIDVKKIEDTKELKHNYFIKII